MKSLDDIAQALEGFDPQALSVDKAQTFIQHLIQTRPTIETQERSEEHTSELQSH